MYHLDWNIVFNLFIKPYQFYIMKNQLKICKICKTCICILQLHILINSVRRRHMPKCNANRKTHLLVWLPNLMRRKISAVRLSYILQYILLLYIYCIHCYVYFFVTVYIKFLFYRTSTKQCPAPIISYSIYQSHICLILTVGTHFLTDF